MVFLILCGVVLCIPRTLVMHKKSKCVVLSWQSNLRSWACHEVRLSSKDVGDTCVLNSVQPHDRWRSNMLRHLIESKSQPLSLVLEWKRLLSKMGTIVIGAVDDDDDDEEDGGGGGVVDNSVFVALFPGFHADNGGVCDEAEYDEGFTRARKRYLIVCDNQDVLPRVIHFLRRLFIAI